MRSPGVLGGALEEITAARPDRLTCRRCLVSDLRLCPVSSGRTPSDVVTGMKSEILGALLELLRGPYAASDVHHCWMVTMT